MTADDGEGRGAAADALPALDDEELDAVLLGLRLVMRRGDGALTAAAHAANAKLAPRATEAARAAPFDAAVVERAVAGADAMLALVRGAMATEHKLALDYRDRKGGTSVRIVWPVALYELDGAEVFAAWCELREDFRHFRIDRIERARRLDERLPAPRRILLAEWEATADGDAF